jgi:hypothetical protein
MDKRLAAVSPLALLTLAACGGGSTGGGASGGGGNAARAFGGAVVKGPMENMLVYVDLDGVEGWTSGVDSAQVRTDSDGKFNISVIVPNGATAKLVAVSDGTAFDSSSQEFIEAGVSLSAPSGSTVVTPVTTIVAESGLSASDVANALGLDGLNLLEYNPYEDADTAQGLLVEQKAHQVMNALNVLKVAGEEAGLTSEAALDVAVGALTTVIEAANAADASINLVDNGAGTDHGLSDITDSFIAKVGSASDDQLVAGVTKDVAAAKVNVVVSNVMDGVATVNTVVMEIPEGTDIRSADISDKVSVGSTLVAQTQKAVETGNGDAVTVSNIAAARNVGKNDAPTDLTLKIAGENVTSIIENAAAGSTVGELAAVDDQSLSFSIVEYGDHWDLFEITPGTNNLVVKEGAVIDFETDETLVFSIKVTDSFGRSTVEEFILNVTDVDEDAALETTAFSANEGEEFSATLDAVDPEGEAVTVALGDHELFDVVDNKLVSKQALTQTDVNNGVVSLTLSLTVGDSVVQQVVTISPVNVNDNPVIDTASIEKATEGASYSQNILTSDEDGDVVTVGLSEEHSWLTLSSDGVLSGTVPVNDLEIAAPETIKVVATDSNGGVSEKNLLLEFININDAPSFTLNEIVAHVVETADAIGVDAALASDNLSGTITAIDLDDENLELALINGVDLGDGKFAITGSYGGLVFDSSDSSYVYTPDVDKIEPLHRLSADDATTDEVFQFKVFDAAGLSDSLLLTVKIAAASDNPRVAAQEQQSFVTLGDGQSGTVIGEVVIFDGSELAGFTLANSSASNNNDMFEKSADGTLKLKDDATTSFSDDGATLIVEVFAEDFDANGVAVADTKSAEPTFLNISVNGSDLAPVVSSIDADYSSYPAAVKIDDEIEFTVTLSEEVEAGGTASLLLSNGVTVSLSVGAVAGQTLEGTYVVAEGDGDTTLDDPLEVTSMNVGNISDGNNSLTQPSKFSDLGDIVVDATAPLARLLGTDDNPHTYDTVTGTLVLQGVNLGTIVATGDSFRDVTGIVNWSDLSWDVDGAGSVVRPFAEADITSAIVNEGGTKISVNLNDSAKTALTDLAGFGGIGGDADVIKVSAGFLVDKAGNESTRVSTAASSVALTDTTAPVLKSINVKGAFTSTDLDADSRDAGDSFIVGDTLTYSATIQDRNDLRDADGMKVTLLLSNSKNVVLERADGATGATKVFSGDYVIQEGDVNSAGLTVASYSVTNLTDIAGNEANNEKLLSDVDKTQTGVATSTIVVDANSPTAQVLGTVDAPHTYDTATNVLVLQGANLGTIKTAPDNSDVKSIVDWTKVTWAVDGGDSVVRTLAVEDVSTAVVADNGNSMTVTLTTDAATALHDLSGFGGTTASSGTSDSINVADGFLKDASGNLSSKASTPTSTVALVDLVAPELSTIAVVGEYTSAQAPGRDFADPADTFIAGDTLTYTATLSADSLRDVDDMSVSLTLSNSKVLSLTRAEGANASDTTFSAEYVIIAGDTDADELTVTAYDIINVSDISGNTADNSKALATITYTALGSDQANTPISISVDANAPNAKLLGTEDDPHTYNTSSGELTLKGESLGTIQLAADDFDVKPIVDWTKLTWDVDGTGSQQFELVDVDTAVVAADGLSITVVLSNVGTDKFHGFDDFGGTVATGGTPDNIGVEAGFLRDAAGNLSSETSTATSTVVLADITSPEFAVGALTSDVSNDGFVGLGDEIKFTALVTDADLADGAEMILSLNNGGSVTMTKPADVSDALYLVGTYTVATGQDTLLADGSYELLTVATIDASGVRDVSGNAVVQDASDLALAVDISEIKVDAIAPTIQGVIFDASENDVIIVFDEMLTDETTAAAKSLIENLADFDLVTVSGTENTTLTLSSVADAGTFATGGSPNVDPYALTITIGLDDLAGNELEIAEFEIGSVI